MSLKVRVTEDMKQAMRDKDAMRLGTIRMLLAAVKQKEVDERIELTDEQVIGLVDKLIKQRKDSVAAFEAAQREDLAEQERLEMDVLKVYLPERLDAVAVTQTVKQLAAQLQEELGRAPSAADMGKLMGLAKAALIGKADMSLVSQAVKAQLQAAA